MHGFVEMQLRITTMYIAASSGLAFILVLAAIFALVFAAFGLAFAAFAAIFAFAFRPRFLGIPGILRWISTSCAVASTCTTLLPSPEFWSVFAAGSSIIPMNISLLGKCRFGDRICRGADSAVT